MKGLLLKDYYCLKQYLRQYVFFFLFFGIVAAAAKDPFYVSLMGLLLGMTFMFSSLVIDEQGGFSFDMTLPVRRKTIVQGKYALLLIGFTAIFIVSAACGMAVAAVSQTPAEEWLIPTGATTAVYLVMLAIVLPIALKWKVERARIALLGVVALPTVLLILCIKIIGKDQIERTGELLFQKISWQTGLAAAVAGLVLIYVISYLISVRIFSRKEL